MPDIHVMPRSVWEQLGELALRPFVKGFMGKTKAHFTATVASDSKRSLLSGTQLRAKAYTFTLK